MSKKLKLDIQSTAIPADFQKAGISMASIETLKSPPTQPPTRIFRADDIAFRRLSSTAKELDSLKATGQKALDITFDTITQKAKGAQISLAHLTHTLTHIRSLYSTENWKEFIKTVVRTHPLMSIILQEPCTYRSYSKPRGYAGDAVMLDYLYQRVQCESKDTTIQAIAHCVVHSEAAQSVCSRLQLISARLSEKIKQNPNLKVLSIACGHAPEWALIPPELLNQSNVQFFGLDSDKASLQIVEKNTHHMNAKTIHASLLDLIKNNICLDQFDFVYSLGMYDYLNTKIATTLSKKLFNMLAPAGELLIANFATTTRDVGYMEAFMDWFLIYRNPEDFLTFMPSLLNPETASITLFADQPKQIILASVVKI